MVSLVTRSEYFRNLDSDKYTVALLDFLFGQEIEVDERISISNANDASVFAFHAIQDDDKKQFSEIYQEISLRKPKPDSDWIYNEILLFSFVLGVCKFGLDHQWLIEVLELRLLHSQKENKLVAQTYLDVIAHNFENTNNFQPLMIVFRYFLENPVDDEKYINNVYRDLIRRTYPHYKSAFLNIMAIQAYDIIVISKGLVDLEQQKNMAEFVKKFARRINQFANLLWLVLLIAVFAVSIWFLNFYLTTSPQQSETIDKILTFIPFLGFSGLTYPVFKYRSEILAFFKKPFWAFFGYRLGQDDIR